MQRAVCSRISAHTVLCKVDQKASGNMSGKQEIAQGSNQTDNHDGTHGGINNQLRTDQAIKQSIDEPINPSRLHSIHFDCTDPLGQSPIQYKSYISGPIHQSIPSVLYAHLWIGPSRRLWPWAREFPSAGFDSASIAFRPEGEMKEEHQALLTPPTGPVNAGVAGG